MHIARGIKYFYDRNLFERLIVYLCVSTLLSKLIFELILGQWYFEQSQNQQWFFYGLLASDYLISYKKVINIRFSINRNSAFAFLLLIMIMHGLAVGLSLDNTAFTMLNDLIPLLMIALNILRMQSSSENQKSIDFDFLLKFVIVSSFVTCLLGYIAISLGKPATSSVEVSQIFFPLFLAALITTRPFPKPLFILSTISILLSLQDINRTTMIFLALVFLYYVTSTLIKKPIKGGLLLVAAIATVSLGISMLPKDSQTYIRIVSTLSLDLSSRKGSVGERQAERDAIQEKLTDLGPTYNLLGLGLGGLYDVAFTHRYITDYGHAHYAWSWFNLRFGKIGYIYMSIMFALLIANAFQNSMQRSPEGIFMTLIVVLGVLYFFTYINGIFILSGLHFFHSSKRLHAILPENNKLHRS